MATGDGGRMPGIGGVLATAAIAARFGAEFLGAMSLTPVSGRLVPALTSPTGVAGDGTVMGRDATGGGGGGGGGDAAATTLMNEWLKNVSKSILSLASRLSSPISRSVRSWDVPAGILEKVRDH